MNLGFYERSARNKNTPTPAAITMLKISQLLFGLKCSFGFNTNSKTIMIMTIIIGPHKITDII